MKKEDEKQAKLEMSVILSQFVKNKSGIIYHVLQSQKTSPFVQLYRRNKRIKKKLVEVKQGLVTGEYSAINEHEYKEWAKEEREYMDTMNRKVIKRVIFSQLLLETDDELMQYNEDKPYLKNQLKKCDKELERTVSDQYDRLYTLDKDFLINIVNRVDEFASVASQLSLEDFLHLGEIVKEFAKDPEKYRKESLEFTKLK